jgi:hypothetical protein
MFILQWSYQEEAFEKCSFSFKFKDGDPPEAD